MAGRKKVHDFESLEVGKPVFIGGAPQAYPSQYVNYHNKKSAKKIRFTRHGDRVYFEAMAIPA